MNTFQKFNLVPSFLRSLKSDWLGYVLAVICLFLIAAIHSQAYAGTATLTWTNPTTYTDGTAIGATDITQTRAQYGSCVGTAFGVSAGQVTFTGVVTTGTIPGLAPGSYCFQVFTTAKGVESAASNVVSKILAQPAPNPAVLSTTITVAYDVRWSRQDHALVLNQAVGTVPLGTACMAGTELRGGYYQISAKAVKFSRKARSSVIVSACA
jgi:hypothetical protein